MFRNYSGSIDAYGVSIGHMRIAAADMTHGSAAEMRLPGLGGCTLQAFRALLHNTDLGENIDMCGSCLGGGKLLCCGSCCAVGGGRSPVDGACTKLHGISFRLYRSCAKFLGSCCAAGGARSSVDGSWYKKEPGIGGWSLVKQPLSDI